MGSIYEMKRFSKDIKSLRKDAADSCGVYADSHKALLRWIGKYKVFTDIM